jgi:hypothetical protein
VDLGYSAVHGFRPVEDLAELLDGPTGCGEVAKGGCLCAWNFSVTWSAVLTVADRRTRPSTNLSPINDSLLAYRLKIPPATNNALHYNKYDLNAALLFSVF